MTRCERGSGKGVDLAAVQSACASAKATATRGRWVKPAYATASVKTSAVEESFGGQSTQYIGLR